LRQQIGMLFQGSALFDSMTVEQNIKFPLDMFTTLTPSEKMKKVNEVLARVNMEGANKKFPSEISGGMKKELVLHAQSFLIQNIFFAMNQTPALIRKLHWLLTN
jgi:phospholipid/cholesterol/gamma-HCH transport system ATP-binding protein